MIQGCVSAKAGGRSCTGEWPPSRRCKRRCTRWEQPKSGHSTLDLSAFCSTLDLEGTIFKILTFLPFHKIHELRIVCKAWNSLLCSPAFLRAWSAAPHEGWLVMVRKLSDSHPFARELIAYEPAADHWMSLQPLLDSCPSAALCILGGPSLRSVANPFYRSELSCLSQFGASAGMPGFVCFLTSPITPFTSPCALEIDLVDRVYNRRSFSLLVLNLLTGAHHNLPSPPKHSDELTSWQLQETSRLLVSMQPLPNNAYRVFLQTQRLCFPGPVEIYDSRSGQWKVGRSCNGPCDAKIASAADLDRADLLQFLDHSCVVFAYSVDLDEWSLVLAEFPYPPVPSGDGMLHALYFKNPYNLFRYRGQVFLAEVQCARSFFRGFTVWKLHMRHSSPPVAAVLGTPIADWVEVTRTPRHLWRFYSIDENNYNVKEVKVISSGSLICMTAVHYTDTNYGGTYYPPLVYDLARDSWYQLPSYKGGDNFIAAFALQPSSIATG